MADILFWAESDAVAFNDMKGACSPYPTTMMIKTALSSVFGPGLPLSSKEFGGGGSPLQSRWPFGKEKAALHWVGFSRVESWGVGYGM